jgi:hypothetical protein
MESVRVKLRRGREGCCWQDWCGTQLTPHEILGLTSKNHENWGLDPKNMWVYLKIRVFPNPNGNFDGKQ